jgi:hypothetical protein
VGAEIVSAATFTTRDASAGDRPRLLVFGTRYFADYDLLCEKLDHYAANLSNPVVVTGAGYAYVTEGRRQVKVGADYLAERWACARYHTVVRFAPDFEAHGTPAAFHVRNREMVSYVAARRPAFAVAFYNGRSPGTKSTIALCKKHGVNLKIVRYRG